MGSGYKIYVDGSEINGVVGYGIVILKDDHVVEEISGRVPEDAIMGTKQVAGEIFAVLKALEWCRSNSIGDVDIFYDYEGVQRWATGDWQTKHPVTKRYADLVRKSNVKVNWHKVEGHSSDIWNNRADKLAKDAVLSLTNKDQEQITQELKDVADGFIEFLKDTGYKATLICIFNSNCAKISLSKGDKDIGYVNIYNTKRFGIVPRYHELRGDQSEINQLWQDYYHKQRGLPLK